jgi:UDP-glucose 4-epimerase
VKLIEQIKPELLNHHAAQMDVRHSVADPQFDAQVNILGFINLLEACTNAGTKKIIFASSGGAVYGEQETFPPPRIMPPPVESLRRQQTDRRVVPVLLSPGLRLAYIALRYANVYGPRQSAKARRAWWRYLFPAARR